MLRELKFNKNFLRLTSLAFILKNLKYKIMLKLKIILESISFVKLELEVIMKMS